MSRRRFTWFNGVALAIGLTFLYVPLGLVVAYSFNASRLVAVWGGFSTRWYGSLLQNEPLKQAAWTSLRTALLSSAVATLLGTAAAYALVRHGRFRGRTLFTGMLYAPMVMPEVITGLSLLLFFVALGLERGFWTVTVAHTTLTIAFVAVVVQPRLTDLDRSLEEAAADLGAPPLRAFLTVTLPLVAPAVGAGFLLAFTLSFDDLVLASFASGPGATTLPMLIYSSVRLGVSPEINAASALMIGLVICLLGLASALSHLRYRANGSQEGGLPGRQGFQP